LTVAPLAAQKPEEMLNALLLRNVKRLQGWLTFS
jgi:hypothetical protein